MKRLQKIIVASLFPLALAGCQEEVTTTQVEGEVTGEKRVEEWYQVTLADHNLRAWVYGDSFEVRFYGNDFDLDKIDKKINPGTRLEFIGTRILNKQYNSGYNFRAEYINKIE